MEGNVMITLENIGTKNGLYVVRVEKSEVVFDAWNDDYVLQNESEVKYVLVNDYKAFERWLEEMYAKSGACKIEYRKLSESVMLIK
jgi:predicted MarR family transcription regulator